MNEQSSEKSIANKLKQLYKETPIHYTIIAIALFIILISMIVILATFESDNKAPSIDFITGDISATEGDIVTIQVNFSDNNEVSYAKLFYKPKSQSNFSSKSILSKTAEISLPLNSGEDWEYYVVIDDPAGNGPVGMPSVNGNITYLIAVLQKNDETNDSSNETMYKRYVFLEESTAESCHNCPDVAQYLHELKDSGKYNFHYVTLVEEDSNAKSRMDEYNVQAYPVVFVDGGYEVLLGKKEKGIYENAIQSALDRETPDIKINLSATYSDTNNKIDIEVNVINEEQSKYSGKLKVYLAEIVSTKYQDSDGEQYKNAFLEFAINEDITIDANSEETKTKTLDGDTFDPENLLVYAVVFSDEKHEKFQDETQQSYPFNAYYVDACTGVQVVEGGNLPPKINISSPENGKVYLMGKKINLLDSFTFQQTILLGQCTFSVEASDSDGIDKIELYVDNILIQTFNDSSIEYVYRNSKWLSFAHTVSFKAYDTQGKISSASLDIKAVTLRKPS